MSEEPSQVQNGENNAKLLASFSALPSVDVEFHLPEPAVLPTGERREKIKKQRLKEDVPQDEEVIQLKRSVVEKPTSTEPDIGPFQVQLKPSTSAKVTLTEETPVGPTLLKKVEIYKVTATQEGDMFEFTPEKLEPTRVKRPKLKREQKFEKVEPLQLKRIETRDVPDLEIYEKPVWSTTESKDILAEKKYERPLSTDENLDQSGGWKVGKGVIPHEKETEEKVILKPIPKESQDEPKRKTTQDSLKFTPTRTPEVPATQMGLKPTVKSRKDVSKPYDEQLRKLSLTLKKPAQEVLEEKIEYHTEFTLRPDITTLTPTEPQLLKEEFEQSPPQILIPMESVAVEMGSPVTLFVRFNGFPLPKATWYFNGKLMVPKEGVTLIDDDYITTLKVECVDKKITGKYEVVVENEFGRVKTSGTIRIIGELYILIESLSLMQIKNKRLSL